MSPNVLHAGQKVNGIYSSFEADLACRILTSQTPEPEMIKVLANKAGKVPLKLINTSRGKAARRFIPPFTIY